ncbi:MAG: hypothetical protein JXD18_03910 [Anaerolineae bacterium]|nr:hypothetical protein [Anaerolineae bacterium]
MDAPARRPRLALLIAFCLSLVVYLVAFVLPYNLFAYIDDAPIDLPVVSGRAHLPAVAFLAAFAALFCLYVLSYRICRRHPHAALAPLVLLLGLGLAAALAFTYPVGAGDVVDYVGHGEEVAYFGMNPLVVPPAEIDGAVFARYSAFRYVVPNYGPLWMWVSAAVVRVLGRGSLALNLLGFKAVAIAAYAVQSVLIYKMLKRRAPDVALGGLLFFAWNPLILYEFAVNGHNDATMMALAVLGILLWEMDHPFLMVVALTCSFLVKIPTAPLLPLFLLAAARRKGTGRAFWATLIGGGALAVGVVGLAYLSLPEPLAALANLSERSGLYTHSLPAIVKLGLPLGGVSEEAASRAVRAASMVALGGWYAVRVWRAWTRPGEVLRHAYDVVLFLLLFVTPWFQPWYVTWLVALAALRPYPTSSGQAGLLSLTVLGSYVIYGFVWFWYPAVGSWANWLGINLIAVAGTFALPWTYTIWAWLRRDL